MDFTHICFKTHLASQSFLAFSAIILSTGVHAQAELEQLRVANAAAEVSC